MNCINHLLISLSALALAHANMASAVEVVRCPISITVNLDSIEALSDAGIRKELRSRPQPAEVEKQLFTLRNVLQAKGSSITELNFDLVRTQDGQCGYWLSGSVVPSKRQELLNRETRLYSTGGTNVLRVNVLDLSSMETANVFLIVTDYKSTGLKTKPAAKLQVMASPKNADTRNVRFAIGVAENVSAN